MAADHVAREALRVASSRGALLLVGRVRRDPQSVNARIRRQMLELLEQTGRGGRDGQSRSGHLIETLVAHGAEAFNPVVAAGWTASHSPAESLRGWRSKQGLGGTDIPEPLKNEILAKLEKWATQTFDRLETSFESTEEYLLEGVRLPAA